MPWRRARGFEQCPYCRGPIPDGDLVQVFASGRRFRCTRHAAATFCPLPSEVPLTDADPGRFNPDRFAKAVGGLQQPLPIAADDIPF